MTHAEGDLTELRRFDRRERNNDLERLITWYFPPREHTMALWVAWQVSGLESDAFHRDGGAGVGLFNLTTEDCNLDPDLEWRLTIPLLNIAAAHRIWAQKGWTHWKVPPLSRVFAEPKDGEAF